MSSRLRSVVFATVLCIVCSLLLTAASSGLKRFHQKNMQLDRQRNILKSVQLITDQAPVSAEKIETLYARNIQQLSIDAEGRILPAGKTAGATLPIYLYRSGDHVKAYIVPINTRGLWGRIYGYLAIENDGKTISGFTVYKHSETPGLGGEIEKRWFQQNFVGKKIVDQAGQFVSISIAKGPVRGISTEKQSHYVDGISGATLTGKYLSAGLRETLMAYEPVSIRFRKNTAVK